MFHKSKNGLSASMLASGNSDTCTTCRIFFFFLCRCEYDIHLTLCDQIHLRRKAKSMNREQKKKKLKWIDFWFYARTQHHSITPTHVYADNLCIQFYDCCIRYPFDVSERRSHIVNEKRSPRKCVCVFFCVVCGLFAYCIPIYWFPFSTHLLFAASLIIIIILYIMRPILDTCAFMQFNVLIHIFRHSFSFMPHFRGRQFLDSSFVWYVFALIIINRSVLSY